MLTYKDIFELDIKLWNWLRMECDTEKELWECFLEYYKDPDGYCMEDGKFKLQGGIECTVDGLLSIKRIYEHEKTKDDFINAFKCYRKTPIIFFPKEANGINCLRAKKLEDRIDHTLLDLKKYCEERSDECRLHSAYILPKTKKWLDSFNYSFKEIVEWLDIVDIFVDENYDIFDLEKKDGSILSELREEYISPRNRGYFSAWTMDYYNNVKEKILEYEKRYKILFL